MPVVIPRTVPDTIGSAAGKSLGIRWLEPECLIASPLSLSVYGDPSADLESLKESIREQAILVLVVVAAGAERGTWDILSGHRRWACAVVLGLIQVPAKSARSSLRRFAGVWFWNTTASGANRSVN